MEAPQKPFYIQCQFSHLIPISELKPNPRNPNKHPERQIEELAYCLQQQGVRKPIVVSALSGYIVTGHGTLEAMKKNGWETAPVDIQVFKDEAQEYAHIVADNALQQYSDLDFSMINFDLPSMGPEMDMRSLGLPEFKLDASEKERHWKMKCPHCGVEIKKESRE